MNTSKRLKDLTREVIHFAEVTHQADSTYNNDLRFACELFSQYLHHELDDIESLLLSENSNNGIQQTSDTLSRLSDLIDPADMQQPDSNQWQAQLMRFNSQVENLKHAAS